MITNQHLAYQHSFIYLFQQSQNQLFLSGKSKFIFSTKKKFKVTFLDSLDSNNIFSNLRSR